MSYENSICPCGGKKPTDTMLCDACEDALADHPAMGIFKDLTMRTEARRHAAITLVTLARKRNLRPADFQEAIEAKAKRLGV